MSEEKKSVRRLLQSPDSFGDPLSSKSSGDWREAVLMQIEDEAETSRPALAAPRTAPLQPRHALLLAPAGIALFGMGWWFGSGGLTAEEIASVSPVVWVAFSACVAVITLLWQGVPSGLFRRS